MKPPAPWTAFARATPVASPPGEAERIAAALHVPLADVQRQIDTSLFSELWKNSRYQVAIDRASVVGENWPPMIHLSIKSLDRRPIHDWRDLQRIKNELLGPEYEAVELYPRASRVVDLANQYHLYAFADPALLFPFGFADGMRSDAPKVGQARQRKGAQP